MATIVKECFEAVVTTSAFPRSEIDIFIEIIQTDGGLLHAGINAATLALIDAGIPMIDYVASCSSGYANEQAILDLNYIEENAEAPLLTLAILPKSEKVLVLETVCRLHLDNLEDCLNLAKDGCVLIAEKLDNIIRQQDSEIN
jgi:exosome complex component RRP41